MSDETVAPEAKAEAPPAIKAEAPPAVKAETKPETKAGPTLVEGGGEEDAPQEAPANWPANWRDIMAGGDDKALAKLNRYTSPANIWKALSATSAKISSGELLRSKPDGKDTAALNEWRAQAGIPEKPEGYLDKLPDGLVVGENDKPLMADFSKAMHEIDAPPNVVRAAVAWHYANQEKMIADRAEADRANRTQAEDALRSEWGSDYRGNQNAITGLLDTYGNESLKEKLFSARLGNGNPLGDDPEVMKFLAGLARQIDPHGTVTPATGQTVMQTIRSEKAALEREMANTRNPDPESYWRNPSKQARYTELIEIERQQKGRAA